MQWAVVKPELLSVLGIFRESNDDIHRIKEALFEAKGSLPFAGQEERNICNLFCRLLPCDPEALEDVLLRPNVAAWLCDLCIERPSCSDSVMSLFWTFATQCNPKLTLLFLEKILLRWAR